jgi:hypothetical protein
MEFKNVVEVAKFVSISPKYVLEEKAKEILEKNFCNKITLYYYACQIGQINKFPAISVTGRSCALLCKHCKGIFLNHMIPATTPKKLYEKCLEISKAGAEGCLISGGCDVHGKVPLKNFIPVISKIKKETDLFINVHPGLVTLAEAEKLYSSNVDAISLDIVGSNQTIYEVYGLSKRVEDYANTYSNLFKAGFKAVSPHVTIGLHFGKLLGELKALDIIRKEEFENLVLIILTPTKGTDMEDVKVKLADIERIFYISRFLFPTKPISLGCMKSYGKFRREIEKTALMAGLNKIATPTKALEKFLVTAGLNITKKNSCCISPC